METKEEFDRRLEDYQQWQRDVLYYTGGTPWTITHSQRKMLKTVLPLLGDELKRSTIQRVLRDGEYLEEDKRILNRVRDIYLLM